MEKTLLADIILAIHFAFVAFVVFGLLLILLGLIRKWQWVRNFWFRAAHLGCILFVIGESWAGFICPLTLWEAQLRYDGGGGQYPDGFIAYWMHRTLYYQAEPWVFTLAYSLFGLLVVITFIAGPPRMPWKKSAT